MMLREARPAILTGLGSGIACALVCGRYVESQLIGVSGNDPIVFLLSAAILLATSLVALLTPVCRALTIQARAAST
jgi:hypothetical protein